MCLVVYIVIPKWSQGVSCLPFRVFSDLSSFKYTPGSFIMDGIASASPACQISGIINLNCCLFPHPLVSIESTLMQNANDCIACHSLLIVMMGNGDNMLNYIQL